MRVDEIRDEVLRYLDMGRIVILLEPSNFLDNLYSFNIRFEDRGKSALMEIVGPGFDASDLQRGHVTPHESIILDLIKLEKNINKLEEKRLELNELVLERKIIDRLEYIQSVWSRYKKIARRLIEIGKVRKPNYDLSEKELVNLARSYLIRNNYRLLLDNEYLYKPIPNKFLIEIFKYIYNLPERLKKLINYNEFVISGGYIWTGKRLVFWDITIRGLKYKL